MKIFTVETRFGTFFTLRFNFAVKVIVVHLTNFVCGDYQLDTQVVEGGIWCPRKFVEARNLALHGGGQMDR